MSIKRSAVLIPIVLSASLLGGCFKPFNKPVFVDIEPNETAFVIPLTGKTSDQAQFQSVEYLLENQVAAKRIQIPRTWYQTKRGKWRGVYKEDVRVIVIDRFPETREWSGKSTFVGESIDSIKFNQGMSATAQIEEGDDSAKFLFKYAGKELKDVMSVEVRNKIGSVLLEQYGDMTIDEIRASKRKIVQSVREEVEPYFKKEGITITNIGYIGDLKYLQEDIQEAINKDFKAQQDQKAQATINKTKEEQAESEAIQAKKQAETVETLSELRELELKAEWIKKWDGQLPRVQTGESSGMMMTVDAEDK